jgi:Ras-related protein Rab-5C
MASLSTKSSSIKIVLVGPSNAGKTSIAKRFTTDTFDEFQDMTVGSAFFSKQVTSKTHKTTVRVELWDTAGQEKFRSVAPMYFRNAAGALLVFDATVPSSFDDCEKQWLPELLPHLKNSTQFIALCGNKSDLVKSDEKSVQFLAKVETLAAAKGLRYFQTSAKRGDNVSEVFQFLVDEILEHRQNVKQQNSVADERTASIALSSAPEVEEKQEQTSKKSGGCCKKS